ncbi:Triacylglycerol lipase [Bertholletia excelsa]
MVNVVAAVRPILHGVAKLAGLTPQKVEIEPGTIINIWVPKQTVVNKDHEWKKPNKPVVVLAHPFSADGITMWLFQAMALAGDYAVYVPDFLFFGGSTTSSTERTALFQAECLCRCLRKVGVERCTVVGLSYGGMVAFKMARLDPDLVKAMVVSSTVIELTESISNAWLPRHGFASWSELLLPRTPEGVKVLFTVGTHKLPWLPHFFYKDYLEAMFDHRKEQAELLEALVVSDKDSTVPDYPQRIYFLWADDDKIFNLELANSMKKQLGEKASLQYIKNAGHLVQWERPCAYTSHLKEILASIYQIKKQI